VTMSDKADRATYEVEVGVPSQPIDRENSPMADPIPMEIPSSKPRALKGKKLVFFPPIVADKVKPRMPFTRASKEKHILVKDDTKKAPPEEKGKYQSFMQPIEVVDITTPHNEINPTFKRLKRQIKEARAEVDKLKKEDLGSRKKLKEMLGMYH